MLAAVLGCSFGWEQDLAQLGALVPLSSVAVYAVNRAGVHYADRIHGWASHHPEMFPQWLEERTRAGGNTDFLLFSSTSRPPVSGPCTVLSHELPSGSSALLGVRAALLTGCTRIVMLGCALDDPGYRVYRAGWDAMSSHLLPHVRSFRGYPHTLFGPPTPEWIEGGPHVQRPSC